MIEKRELRVEKIKDGTVIDHITAGTALAVLRILGITGKEEHIVSVLMNVPSGKLGRKDIVKIEGRELSPEEVDRIALVSPRATINIIRNFEVVRKEPVKPPFTIRGVLECQNVACVTNSREPVKPVFQVEGEGENLTLRCYYCGAVMNREEFLKQF